MHLAKEKIIAAIDIGSSKIAILIAQLPKESAALTVIGVSTVPAKGIRKGQVVDIDEAVSSLAAGLESAERMAGYSVSSAYVSVGGSQIASMNSRGVVAVSGPDGEITDEDIRHAVRVIADQIGGKRLERDVAADRINAWIEAITVAGRAACRKADELIGVARTQTDKNIGMSVLIVGDEIGRV